MNETINSPLLNDNIIETNDDTISTGSTGSTGSTKECWICKEIVERHIRFCDCNGYISYVHKECLNKWLITSQKTRCDFCGRLR